MHSKLMVEYLRMMARQSTPRRNIRSKKLPNCVWKIKVFITASFNTIHGSILYCVIRESLGTCDANHRECGKSSSLEVPDIPNRLFGTIREGFLQCLIPFAFDPVFLAFIGPNVSGRLHPDFASKNANIAQTSQARLSRMFGFEIHFTKGEIDVRTWNIGLISSGQFVAVPFSERNEEGKGKKIFKEPCS